MQNFIQDGKILTLTGPSGGKSSGDPVLVGDLFGVVVADAAEDESMQVATEGVFELTKETADEVTEGANLYWNVSSGKLTIDPDGNKLVAQAVAAAAATTATTVKARLVSSLGQNAAENVTFSAGSNLSGVDGAGSNAAPLAGTETRLDALDTAVVAILAKLKEAGLMEAD